MMVLKHLPRPSQPPGGIEQTAKNQDSNDHDAGGSASRCGAKYVVAPQHHTHIDSSVRVSEKKFMIVKQAENLLVASSLSIKEIAAEAGFTDANHLCKAFHAHFQCSPGDYRRMATSSAVR